MARKDNHDVYHDTKNSSTSSKKDTSTAPDEQPYSQHQKDIDDFAKKVSNPTDKSTAPDEDYTPYVKGGNDGDGDPPSVEPQKTAQVTDAYSLAKAAYDKALREQRKAQQQAINSQVSAYNNQKSQVQSQAEEAARQAYISKMLNQRDLGQRLSASGYSGGLTDTAEAQLIADYENNRQAIMNNKNQALNDINSAIANVRANGAGTMANYQQQYADKIASLYLDQLSKANSNNNSNADKLKYDTEFSKAYAHYYNQTKNAELAQSLAEEYIANNSTITPEKAYSELSDSAKQLVLQGQPISTVLDLFVKAYQQGYITKDQYTSLYNQYKNFAKTLSNPNSLNG